MPLRTLDIEEPPLVTREELTFSRNHCANHPLANKHEIVFVALLDEWQATFAKLLALQDKLAQAESRVKACDDEFDVFVDDVAAAILLGNNDRNSPEFRSYFGSKQPFETKKPILGDELELVRAWVPLLKGSANPLLANLAPRGDALCAKADGAVSALGIAKQELRTFRLTGEYSQFIDKANATRKAVYGDLAKARHEAEGKNLPGDFADGFFRHETRRNKKLTIDGVRERIAALEAELARQNDMLTALESKATAEEQAEAARKALEIELEDAEKARIELERKTADLRAKLKK